MKIIKRFLCLSIIISVVLLGGCNQANSSLQSSLENETKKVMIKDLEIDFEKEIIGDRIETDKPLFQSYIDILDSGNYTYSTFISAGNIKVYSYRTQKNENYYSKAQSVDNDGPIEDPSHEALYLKGTYYYRFPYLGRELEEMPEKSSQDPTDPIGAIMRDRLKYVGSQNITISGDNYIVEEWERYNSERAEVISSYLYFKNGKLVSINHISPKDTLTVIYIIEFENEADESKLVEPK